MRILFGSLLLLLAGVSTSSMAQPQPQQGSPAGQPARPGQAAPRPGEVKVLDGGTTRSFHAITARGPRRFESSAEAQEVLDKIVQFVPMPHPVLAFVTDDQGDVANAEARMSADNMRIIGFNRAFMRQVKIEGGNYWSLFGIAAHEVGHHAGNHNFLPFDNCTLNNQIELDADYYAGFALGKMNVKLDDATSTLRSLPTTNSCSHPGRELRVQKMGLGWKNATLSQLVASAPGAPGATGGTTVTRSVIPAPPPAAPAAKTALESFKIRKNRDVYGNDLEKTPGLTQDNCAARCLKNSLCKGFSFDRWNGWCFLKSAMPGSVLDPASVIAVRDADSFPNVVTSPSEMFRLRRKKFNDAAFATGPSTSYEDCTQQCTNRLECIAYTYRKSDGMCQQFSETVGHFYDEGFDSGFKRQRPAIATPVAASGTARMQLDRGKYFKGDGYAKHEDASPADCDALCLRDNRCQATEYIEKERVCRLYDVPEQGLATPGTNVSIKRTN